MKKVIVLAFICAIAVFIGKVSFDQAEFMPPFPSLNYVQTAEFIPPFPSSSIN